MTRSIAAGAKVNLFLDVLARRQDGYHEIRTVFLPLAQPADRIHLEPGPRGQVTVNCACPGVPEGPPNLAWKAATAFAAASGTQPAWRITIEKGIPVAAGLGGGSSDAAAVLRILAACHPGAVPGDRLRALAASLGADVPFFLDPRPALAEGIGERLTPVACGQPLVLVLANPRFPVAAAWAYAHRGRVAVPPAPPVTQLLAALAAGEPEALAPLTYNALEYAVLDKFPLVALLAESLRAAGCFAAHVSGSGPTVYGLCTPDRAAEIAASVTARFGSAIWVCATTSALPA